MRLNIWEKLVSTLANTMVFINDNSGTMRLNIWEKFGVNIGKSDGVYKRQLRYNEIKYLEEIWRRHWQFQWCL